MIRHTLHGPPVRRIAVIQIPRGEVSRLGSIRTKNWIAGPNTTALNSWTPLQDLAETLARNYSSLTPESWQAQILQRQQRASEQTPGTLQYTPAPPAPSGATIMPPWTSWSTGDCNPDAGSANAMGVPSPAATAAAAIGEDTSDRPWIILAGILGAAASLLYLKQASKGRS